MRASLMKAEMREIEAGNWYPLVPLSGNGGGDHVARARSQVAGKGAWRLTVSLTRASESTVAPADAGAERRRRRRGPPDGDPRAHAGLVGEEDRPMEIPELTRASLYGFDLFRDTFHEADLKAALRALVERCRLLGIWGDWGPRAGGLRDEA